jgi:hypothetical protein
LHATGWDDIKTIVIDSVTKAEELVKGGVKPWRGAEQKRSARA